MYNASLRPEVDSHEPIAGIRPVVVSRNLPQESAQVFDILANPGHLESFHPFCRRNYPTSWSGSNRQDVLTYLNGMTYIRDFITWQPEIGFDLLIGESKQRQSLVGWRLKPTGSSTSELTIAVYPHVTHGLSPIIAYPLHTLWLKPRLQAYLDSVLSGLQVYLLTHQKVPNNAFGPHPWFS